MKTPLMFVLCCFAMLVPGCKPSPTQASKTSQDSAATKSSSYDPATDTTTIHKDGFTWTLKGDYTNATVEVRP